MIKTGRTITLPFGLKIGVVAAASATLAACGAGAPPPAALPPPPPPPVQVVERVPYRPLPPGGAAYVMKIPGRNAMGLRETINSGLADDEKVWHFRSAWNVAALNCTAAQYQPILDAYSSFIKVHARPLKRINDRLETKYRNDASNRRAGIVAREERMTSVYNYFAMPPARSGFCTAALDISNRYLAAPPKDGVVFAMENFELMEQPFATFFDEYEQYQQLSAQWDAKYGATHGASQPGYLAVQSARARGVEVPTVGESAPETTLASPTRPAGTVVDSATGDAVPVVPVAEGFISQPVIEPVAADTGANDANNEARATPRK